MLTCICGRRLAVGDLCTVCTLLEMISSNLSPRELLILERRLDNYSLTQIAEELSISLERVRQILQHVGRKIRNVNNNFVIDEVLVPVRYMKRRSTTWRIRIIRKYSSSFLTERFYSQEVAEQMAKSLTKKYWKANNQVNFEVVKKNEI